MVSNKIKNKKKGWVQFGGINLIQTISQRDSLLSDIRKSKFIFNVNLKDQLRNANKKVKDAVSIAKSKWKAHLAALVHSMPFSPKTAWQSIKDIAGGFSGHHTKTTRMAMKLPNGNLATTDAENLEVFGPHFEQVYNNHRSIQQNAAKSIRQRTSLTSLDD